jgi:plasmid stabilization system protein ParE
MPDTTYRIRLTPAVADQLQDLFDYIEKVDSADRAADAVRRLLDGIDNLDFMPNRGTPVPDLHEAGGPVRRLVIRPYIVHYQVNDSERVVTILSVFHSAQESTS